MKKGSTFRIWNKSELYAHALGKDMVIVVKYAVCFHTSCTVDAVLIISYTVLIVRHALISVKTENNILNNIERKSI